tara:strand:+ start:114 stop:443 length:330 start_codon:yes stop_codon:yes gene_type:complete
MSNINYTGKWDLDISKMSEAEWDQLVSILEMKGVKMFMWGYDEGWVNLKCSGEKYGLVRTNDIGYTQVSILEMLNLLETPIKSASQLKIEELQQVVDIANDRINELKGL